jgi:sigma-B regulation protein RsbU (phosphoserine phosphatase)
MRTLLLSDPVARSSELEAGLRVRGHDVRRFHQLERALAEFAATPFELVVVALTGDRERGLDFCRRLRKLPDGAWAVVLAITATNHLHEVQEAIRAGADDYLFQDDPASIHDIRLAIAEDRCADKQSRRAMLLELRRSESRFQELLETAPDAILGCDEDGRIHLMNEQAVRLTGYDRAELRGLFIEALVPEPLRQAHAEERCRFFQQPTARPMGRGLDLVLRRKDGGQINVDICLGYHRDGEQLYAIAAIRDITERRRMEQELRLAKEATERAYERIHREVGAAARVQQALLPAALPRSERVRFAYEYHPCAELAGDGLNVFWLDDSHIGLYLLDVSGHGVAASLLSVALARLLSPAFGSPTLLRGQAASAAEARHFVGPADVARSVNQWFLANPTADQFFTMIYAILEVPSLRLQYVSAGHPSMALARSDGSAEWLPSTGIPIGVIPDAVFEESVIALRSGDRLLLYSDGITETRNEPGEMFGSARLRQVMSDAAALPVESFLRNLLGNVLAWSQEEPSDDLSLLALEVR